MKNREKFIKSRFNNSNSVYNKFISNEKNIEQIGNAISIISKSFVNNHKVISCGNGGSMSDAMHFAQELSGRFKRDRLPLPAISISDPSYLTCVSNDYGYDKSFSRMIRALGNEYDTLLAISTSGNSENVIQGIKEAKTIGMNTIALLGNEGGKAKAISDVSIIVPSSDSSFVQETHIKIIHTMVMAIENEIFFSYE